MSSAALLLPDMITLLAAVPGTVLAIDPANRIAYANEAAELFLGQSRRRIEGQAVGAVIRFDRSRLSAALLDADEYLSAQDVAVKVDDAARIVDIALAPLVGQPGWRLLLMTPRPSGQEPLGSKPGEQAALGAPAVLSHEIKNPLAGIKGAAQLLARKAGPEQRKLTDLIIAEVDRIARIIDQMQHLGTRTPLAVQPVNIHAALNRALQSVRGANPLMPDVRIDFDPSLPLVAIDTDAMVQIFINLIQNAVDALRDVAAPRIVVTTRFVMSGALRQAAADSDGQRAVRLPVEVAVADNGPGVPLHIRDDLFSPFVTTKRDGQGLGLAIVRKLMRDMGGRVTHERDAADRWTHFRLALPVADSA